MNDITTPVLTAPKQMKTIITLLNLVKSELFITLDHAERCLEMFISERQSNASLQQFTQALQQIRGSLALIEIKGAMLLTDLMLERATAITEDIEKNCDDILSLLSTSIFKLRRYLENIENYPDLLSQLLIPAINDLRAVEKLPPLPISFFADIKLSYPPLAVPIPKAIDNEAFGRLRQMYQIGLLGLIKEENKEASLRMMSRAVDRLQTVINQEQGVRLCIIAAAALESFTDSNMTPYPARKRVFRQIDQQLRDIQIDHKPCNEILLKDLLYLVLLDNALGPKALTVFSDYNLSPLSYNNSVLETEITNLIGPGQDAICSFTAAITEELTQTQQTIDNFTNAELDYTQLIDPLLTNLKKLLKTLSLVNLHKAEVMLKEQIGVLEQNKDKDSLSPKILDNLADVILNVESIVLQYEANASCNQTIQATPNNTDQTTTNLYLKQGRELAVKETLSSISTAQLNITAYVESKGDKQFLENMPQILDEVYGCLLFLNQPRAAQIVRQCSLYISQDMLIQEVLQDTKQLDNLADILASLEFFIETGMQQGNNADNEVLSLAEESLTSLNAPHFEAPKAAPIAPKPAIQPYTSTAYKTPEKDTFFSTTKEISTPEIDKPLLFEEKSPSANTDETLSFREMPLSIETKDTLFEERSEPTKMEASLFQEESSNEANEIAPSTADHNTLDFKLESFSSFTMPTPDDISKAKKEEEERQLQALKAKSAFSLAPLEDKQTESKEEQETAASASKKDDDDITFTRPDKWTLS